MRDITLKLDARKSDKFEITSQGFLVVDANLTRTGVFDYNIDGKTVRELRPPEEVFKQESLDSLKFAPLTKFHPKEMVNSNNVNRVQVGSIGENIFKRGDFVVGKVVINDKKEVDEILRKWSKGENIELSMGYDAEIVDTTGNHHKDGHYDKMQTNIIYNHGSIVNRGRAGSEVKLIMDAEEEADILKSKKDTEEKRMFKFKRDSVEAGKFKMDSMLEEVDDSAKGVVTVLSDRVDEAAIVILDMQKVTDELQAKHDESVEAGKKLQTKIDELLDPTSEVVQTMIKDRADLEGIAQKVDVKVAHEDGKPKDSKGLKVDIITKIHPEFKADERSDDYIGARFDAVIEFLEVDKNKKAATTLGNFRKDVSDTQGKEPKNNRQKFLDGTRDMHKPKEDK